MSISELLQWWNVIYAAPLVVSLVWIVGTVLSGAHAGGDHGHAGHEAGHGAHDVAHGISHVAHEIGHAMHHGHDGDHGHDVAHGDGHSHDGQGDGKHDHNHDDGRPGGTRDTNVLFAILGIGRVPVTLLVGIFLLCWGAFGLVVNQVLEHSLRYPALYIWPSVGITFGVSFVFTRSLTGVIARVMPKMETFGISRYELVGSLGRTVFATGETSGTVDIHDAYGTVHRVQAKTEPGQESIATGREVMVLDFDQEDKRYVVRTSDI